MSALGEIFQSAGVSRDKLVEIVALLKENPMAAMSAVQQLQLSEDVMQKVMGVVMMNPAAIEELAQELGLSEEDLKAIQSQVKGSLPDA
jgi:hypothetical protein